MSLIPDLTITPSTPLDPGLQDALSPALAPVSYGDRLDAWRRLKMISRSPARQDAIAYIRDRLAKHAAKVGRNAYLSYAHQKACVRDIAGHLTGADINTRALAVIPTAGGKTRIFLSFLDAIMRQGVAPVLPTTLILVPDTTLLVQTRDDIKRTFPHIDPGHFCAAEGAKIRPVTVVTYESFARMTDDGRLSPDDIDLIIMDEAHGCLSETRQDVIERYFDTSIIVAFSATPGYDAGKDTRLLLGPTNAVHISHSRDLRSSGIISPVLNYIFEVELKSGARTRSQRIVQRYRAFNQATIKFLATHDDPETEGRLVDRNMIFFAPSKLEAYMFADAYNEAFGPEGKKMLVVVSDADSPQAQEAAAEVEAGRATAIASCKKLREGFNLPSLKLAICYPTTSLLQCVQRAGRVQRKIDGLLISDPQQKAFVIDAYFRVDGKIHSSPVFYYNAINDMECVRHVRFDLSELNDEPVHRQRELACQDDEGRLSALDGLAQIDYTVSARIEDTVRLDRERNPEGLLKATADWLDYANLARALNLRPSNRGLKALWARIKRHQAAGKPAMIGSAKVDAEMMLPLYASTSTPVLHLHLQALPAVVDYLKSHVYEPTEGWTKLTDLPSALGINPKDRAFRRLMRRTIAHAGDATEISSTNGEWRMRKLQRGSRSHWRLYTQDIPAFQAHVHAKLGSPRRDSELTLPETAKLLGVSEDSIAATWARLARDCRKGLEPRIGRRPAPFRMAIANGHVVGVLDKAFVKNLKKYVPGCKVLTRADISRYLKFTGLNRAALPAAWARLLRARANGQTFSMNGCPILSRLTLSGLRPVPGIFGPGMNVFLGSFPKAIPAA